MSVPTMITLLLLTAIFVAGVLFGVALCGLVTMKRDGIEWEDE